MSVATAPEPTHADFQVHLDVYAGPFDVLLGLISKHKLDVTEVALAHVTDEFVAFVRSAGRFDLDRATGFLVVAATLLDLKAARLLPGLDVEDEDDLALLEARDLLFARLLQYRAYKQAAAWLADAFAIEARWTPRAAGLPDDLAALLPEVELGLGPDALAVLAAAASLPRAEQVVDVEHIHAPRVSVPEHAATISERLLTLGRMSFRGLCQDCSEPIEVVGRFLALLELFREGRVRFEQISPLGDLQISWCAAPPGTPPEEQGRGR
ncbi:MAG: segregation and condensation protein A [Mycobacteriales bacterium]